MRSLKDGGQRFRSCLMRMNDKEISALSDPELIDLARRILEEIELRLMQQSE